MLTPEVRERAILLLAQSKTMADKHGRFDYHIGDYWNFCDEMCDFIEELLDCRAGGASHNPMFETGKTT